MTQNSSAFQADHWRGGAITTDQLQFTTQRCSRSKGTDRIIRATSSTGQKCHWWHTTAKTKKSNDFR